MARNHYDLLDGGEENRENGGLTRISSEWEKEQQLQPRMEQGGLFLKVMTDEQLELLRRQISVYATICEQLVEMHKAVSAQQELAGMRLGNIYCDSLMSSTHKMGARQRWTPAPLQRDILEGIFEQGNGTPSKQKIKEITADLSQHGPITESNVYNWFQNRRARSKRKQSAVAASGGESEETETDVDEKLKPKGIPSSSSSSSMPENNVYAANPGIVGEKVETMFPCDRGLKSSRNLGDLSYYEGFPSNRRFDQLIHKLEDESYGAYRVGEEFDIVG